MFKHFLDSRRIVNRLIETVSNLNGITVVNGGISLKEGTTIYFSLGTRRIATTVNGVSFHLHFFARRKLWRFCNAWLIQRSLKQLTPEDKGL